MQRLLNTGRHLDLSEYGISEEFDVYELGTYDFTENLKFDKTIGVYMFTCKSGGIFKQQDDPRNFFYHEPVYCGKTSDTDTRFFERHKGKKSIKDNVMNAFAFHPCKTDEEACALEDKILSLIEFPENEVNNSAAKYKNSKIKEVKS